jgi:hypothetical protein
MIVKKSDENSLALNETVGENYSQTSSLHLNVSNDLAILTCILSSVKIGHMSSDVDDVIYPANCIQK